MHFQHITNIITAFSQISNCTFVHTSYIIDVSLIFTLVTSYQRRFQTVSVCYLLKYKNKSCKVSDINLKMKVGSHLYDFFDMKLTITFILQYFINISFMYIIDKLNFDKLGHQFRSSFIEYNSYQGFLQMCKCREHLHVYVDINTTPCITHCRTPWSSDKVHSGI